MSLRVAFDETVLELDASGTARSVRGVAAALEARDDVELVPVAHPRGRRRPGGRILRGLERELRWYGGGGVDAAAARERAALLHCPAAIGPSRGKVPLVVTVHDLLALEHPEWFAPANALQQRLVLLRLTRRARAVIVPSRATRDALLERGGAEPERVHVVPFGVGAPFSPGPVDEAALERLGVRRPYVLTVATLQPRKNLEAALAAQAQLGHRVQLVVAGGRGWADDALAARLSGVDGVVLTGRVSDAELVTLQRGAACLVHPSRHEGFGFPPLEAMACGTPVVCVDGGAVPELVGDAGVVVERDDELAGAIAAVVDDPGDLGARGLERAAALSWEACGAATAAVYRAAAG